VVGRVSAARKRKKAARDPWRIEWNRKFDKRYATDPTYRIGQDMLPAPVKYSRCKVCVGNLHHSPWLDGIWQ